MEMVIDPEKQKIAREYAQNRRFALLVDFGLGAIFLLGWIFLDISDPILKSIYKFTDKRWLVVALFSLAFGAIYSFLDLPVSFYSSFILPHRYNLSMQSLRGWVVDLCKNMMVTIVMGLLVVEILYVLLDIFPETWWLFLSVFLFLLNLLMAYIAPLVILPFFNKFEPIGKEHAHLEERLLELTRKAGLQVRGVYKYDMSRRTKQANAGFSGLGRSRRIIIGDTLLNNFSDEEVETILAHELGHQAHRDIPAGLLFSGAMTFAGMFLTNKALVLGANLLGLVRIGEVASLPLLLAILGLMSIVALPFTNLYSRWRERRADIFALELTGKASAFKSAMIRLANQNLSEINPHPLVEFFLFSHPSLSKRIQLAESL